MPCSGRSQVFWKKFYHNLENQVLIHVDFYINTSISNDTFKNTDLYLGARRSHQFRNDALYVNDIGII